MFSAARAGLAVSRWDGVRGGAAHNQHWRFFAGMLAVYLVIAARDDSSLETMKKPLRASFRLRATVFVAGDAA